MTVITVVFSLLLCTSALAQRPTSSPAEAVEMTTVSSLLSSENPAQLAWGAHLAGNYQLTGFAPDLLRLAVSTDWGVRMTALDSIIRVELDVPEQTLRRIADTNMDELLIILARTRAKTPAAYNRLAVDLLTRELRDDHWVALNSILLSRPPAGFAARLIQDWSIHTTLLITDPGEDTAFGFGSSIGTGCFGPSTPPGFPLILAYAIQETPRPGDIVLTSGPHPVGYYRHDPSSGTVKGVDRDEYRWDYLASLAGINESGARSMWFKMSQQSISWKNETKYRTDAQEILHYIERTIVDLKSGLVRLKLLTSEESATLLPKLDVAVRDLRKHSAGPLPEPRWTLSGTQQQ